jgi:hypothetical protein
MVGFQQSAQTLDANDVALTALMLRLDDPVVRPTIRRRRALQQQSLSPSLPTIIAHVDSLDGRLEDERMEW